MLEKKKSGNNWSLICLFYFQIDCGSKDWHWFLIWCVSVESNGSSCWLIICIERGFSNSFSFHYFHFFFLHLIALLQLQNRRFYVLIKWSKTKYGLQRKYEFFFSMTFCQNDFDISRFLLQLSWKDFLNDIFATELAAQTSFDVIVATFSGLRFLRKRWSFPL